MPKLNKVIEDVENLDENDDKVVNGTEDATVEVAKTQKERLNIHKSSLVFVDKTKHDHKLLVKNHKISLEFCRLIVRVFQQLILRLCVELIKFA